MSDKFQNKEVSPLSDSADVAIIRKCWNCEHHSGKEPLAVFMDGVEQDEYPLEDERW